MAAIPLMDSACPGMTYTTSPWPAVVWVIAKLMDLNGASGVQAFAVQGETEKVVLTKIAVQGQSFQEALRAEIKKGSGHEWAVQLQAGTQGPVDEGDVLLATFYLRAEKPLEEINAGQTQFVFELAKEPFTKSIMYDVQAGSTWRKITVPFVAKQKLGAGEAQMIFRLGYEPETIEISSRCGPRPVAPRSRSRSRRASSAEIDSNSAR